VSAVGIPEGFKNQRLVVVPRPVVAEALARPITRRLLVTDAGYFPAARDHERSRPRGAQETIVVVPVSGTGWVRTPAGEARVGSSTAIVLPAGIPHSYGAAPDDPWTIWWIHVRGTDSAELVESLDVRDGSATVSLSSTTRVGAMFDEIVHSLERDQSPARLIATAGMAWRLFTQLAVDRALPERGQPVEKAMRYLQDRVDGTIRVPELAALVGLSASHLSTLFRRATGGGVLTYHLGVKMARARHLLDTTDLTIGEIGREVGMNDQFYFSRQFRQTHGESPSAYRARRKG
jgi:AraC family transcriptional regulator of arabinose operon